MSRLSNVRLRVVPHFSSGIVERAKREGVWKSPDARKGDTLFLARGDFHARSHFASSTIPEEKWGTTRSLVKCCQELCKATFMGVIPLMFWTSLLVAEFCHPSGRILSRNSTMCFVYVTHEQMHKIRLSNKVWHSFILVHPLLNPPPKSCERKSKPKKIVPWFCLRDPRIDAHNQAKW